MKRVVTRFFCFTASAVLLSVALGAQAPAQPPDPRVGLKAGLKDAGQAARNMQLVASLPKPPGFTDPARPAVEAAAASAAAAAPAPAAVAPAPAAVAMPSGTPPVAPTPPTPPAATATPPGTPPPGQPPAAAVAPTQGRGGRGGGGGGASLNYANSDVAFRGDDMFIGNFNGFNAYDIENTKKPRLL
ncbi:MAG: hypothetical protein ABIP65_10270, partial [Vicinamibacterales bacterium]